MRWPRADLDRILAPALAGDMLSIAAPSDSAAQLLRRALYRRAANRGLPHIEIRVKGEVLSLLPMRQAARRIQ